MILRAAVSERWIRFWWWISALTKEASRSFLAPLCHVRTPRKGHHLWARKWSLIRHWICQHLNLGLSCIQNCEKYIFVAYKANQLYYFVIKPRTDWESNPKTINISLYQTLLMHRSSAPFLAPPLRHCRALRKVIGWGLPQYFLVFQAGWEHCIEKYKQHWANFQACKER